MPQTIYLQIGQREKLPLGAFIAALKNFLGLLRDLDAAVSQDNRGSVVWEVVSLHQNSPPIVGVSPTPRSHAVQDMSAIVATQILQNTNLLTNGRDPTAYMSSSAMAHLESLAQGTKRLGRSTVMVNGDGPKQETQITEKTFEHVQQLTQVKYSGYGSVTGKLESITVHNKNEFRVWDEATNKAVTCSFNPAQESLIKDLLRQKVIVAGTVHANSAGVPVKLDAEHVEAASAVLPTIESMSGLVDDLTEGKTLREYLESIGDE
jgi:hypothetical protein